MTYASCHHFPSELKNHKLRNSCPYLHRGVNVLNVNVASLGFFCQIALGFRRFRLNRTRFILQPSSGQAAP